MTNDKKLLNTNVADSTSNQKEHSCGTKGIRAAIYTRTVQLDQADYYAKQVKMCSDYIFKNGWTLCDIFFDEGTSGKAIERPELLLMVEKAAKYRFDVIVVSSIDRLARSPEELMEAMSLFRDFHVALQSVNELEMTSFGLDQFSHKFS